MKTRQVKLKELIISEVALVHLSQKPISARMSMTLAEVLRVVSPVLENFRKQHAALIKKYGTPKKDVSGNILEGQYEFGEQREVLDAEYEELIEMSIELPIGRIKLADLVKEKIGKHKEGDKDIDDFLLLTGQDIYQLSWLLKVELTPMFEDSD